MQFENQSYEFIHDAKGKLSNVGFGSYGEVKLARYTKNGEIVAIKMINGRNAKDEIDVHHKLDHPNIIRLLNYYYEKNKNITYMILQYASNGSLYDKIKFGFGQLSMKLVISYFRQICQAVKYLHSHNYMHRDIKPQNVLITKNNQVKLCDFGFATIFEMRITLCGTFEYMAPEMIQKKPYNHKIDIWALGILLFEMIQGTAPFRGQNGPDVMAQMKKPLTFSSRFQQQSIDLVKMILRVNSENRPDINTILKHSFLNQNNNLNNVKVIEKTVNNNNFIYSPKFNEPKLNNIKINDQKSNINPKINYDKLNQSKKNITKINNDNKINMYKNNTNNTNKTNNQIKINVNTNKIKDNLNDDSSSDIKITNKKINNIQNKTNYKIYTNNGINIDDPKLIEKNTIQKNELSFKTKEISKLNDLKKTLDTSKINDNNKIKDISKQNDTNKSKDVIKQNDTSKSKEIVKLNDKSKGKEIIKLNDTNKSKDIVKLSDTSKSKQIVKLNEINKAKQQSKLNQTSKINDISKFNNVSKQNDVNKTKDVSKVNEINLNNSYKSKISNNKIINKQIQPKNESLVNDEKKTNISEKSLIVKSDNKLQKQQLTSLKNINNFSNIQQKNLLYNSSKPPNKTCYGLNKNTSKNTDVNSSLAVKNMQMNEPINKKNESNTIIRPPTSPSCIQSRSTRNLLKK